MTKIYMIDENGNISHLATYSLEPKKALIAYYMQNEKNNFNTWNYPSDLEIIKHMSNGSDFAYFKGDSSIFTRSA